MAFGPVAGGGSAVKRALRAGLLVAGVLWAPVDAASRRERETWAGQAQTFFNVGKYAEARDQWLRALDGASRSEKRRWSPWIGRTYEAEGNYQKALTAYQEAYDAHPESVDRLVDLARTYDTVELSERALELYERAFQKDRSRRDVELALGALHYRAGRLTEARRRTENVLRRDPRDPSGQELMARIEESEGRLADAARRREKMWGDRPTPAGALALGRLWVRTGELELAEDAFRRAAEGGDTSAALAYERGAVAWRRGNLDSAETFFETALERDSGHFPSALLWSVVEWERGRSVRAVERLRALRPSADSVAAVLRDRLLLGAPKAPVREETK